MVRPVLPDTAAVGADGHVEDHNTIVSAIQTVYNELDTKGVASGYASLDSSGKIPITQIPTGTTGSTVALGNHTHAGGGGGSLDDGLSGAWFSGKKWTALGTSITAENSYTAALATLSGMVLDNKGVSGGSLSTASNGTIWNALTTGVGVDAEVITIETINDFRLNVPLGTISDPEAMGAGTYNSTTTYYSALKAACNWILTNRPAARAFFFTAYGDAMNAGYPNGETTNSHGKYYWEYNEAMKRVCSMYGIPVIDVAGESGINFHTCTYYTTDMIHMNALGGKRYGQYAWSRMRLMGWLDSRPTTPGQGLPVAVTGVTIDQGNSPLALAPADTQQLSVTIAPANATDKSVVWSTNNAAAAAVTPDGRVTAVANGSAVITATTVDGSFTDTITVNVAGAAVSGVSVTPDTYSGSVGGTQQLTATITPTNATNKTVTWSSSNNAAATVSAGGLVTLVGVGTATITATTTDGGFTDTCAVTATAAVAEWDLTAQTAFSQINLSGLSSTGSNPGYTATVVGTYGALLIAHDGSQNAIEFELGNPSKGTWFVVGSGAGGAFFGLGDASQGTLAYGGGFPGDGSVALSGPPSPPTATGLPYAAGSRFRIGRSGTRVKIVHLTSGGAETLVWDGNLAAVAGWSSHASKWTAIQLGVLANATAGSTYTLPINCKSGTWTP